MQITLVQNEIEKAIREYVGRQLVVADGMEMTIELAATRGAEGFKAIIDIVPENNRRANAPVPAMVKITFPNAPAALVKAAEESKKLSEPIEVSISESPFSESPSTSYTDTPEDQSDEHVASEEAPAAPVEQAPVPAPTSNTRSLFKSMTKPKSN